jgi:2-oxoglutarate dehydrogenase E1 component
MTGDTIFERYLPEPHPAELEAPENIKRHILCTGKQSRARDRKLGLL